jgi:hypothetical protein
MSKGDLEAVEDVWKLDNQWDLEDFNEPGGLYHVSEGF